MDIPPGEFKGKNYKGITIVGYIPYNPKGHEALRLMKKLFFEGLIFQTTDSGQSIDSVRATTRGFKLKNNLKGGGDYGWDRSQAGWFSDLNSSAGNLGVRLKKTEIEGALDNLK
jgi:hypothetical protein